MRHHGLGWVVMLAALGGVAPAQTNTATAPEIEVRGLALKEAQAVGPYEQPEWTTARRFPTTRVYIQKTPWEQGVEGWWRGRWYKDGSSKHRYEAEYEVGLPGRLQLDIYQAWLTDKAHVTKPEYSSVELRWALADWGVIPLNPTLYGEAKYVPDGANVLEGKLLLGDQLGQRLHWGVNFVWEEETGGERTRELAISHAASYTLVDRRLSVGYELKFTSESVAGDRASPEKGFGLGPSLQWRPTNNLHIDAVTLFGISEDAPRLESYLVIGWDFGVSEKTPRAAIHNR